MVLSDQNIIFILIMSNGLQNFGGQPGHHWEENGSPRLHFVAYGCPLACHWATANFEP